MPAVAAAALLIALLSPRVSALTLTVRPDGSGDIRTIQQAVDSLAFLRPGDPGFEEPNTVALAPGFFDELVVIRGIELPLRMTGLEGASRTTVRAVAMPETQGGRIAIQGVTLHAPIVAAWDRSGDHVLWSDCIFESEAAFSGRGAGIRHCEFRAPVWLNSFDRVDSCRFEAAPLELTNYGYDTNVWVTGCDFAGPAPIGVGVTIINYYGAILSGCRFAGVDSGVVVRSLRTIVQVGDCSFDDVRAVGVAAVGITACNEGRLSIDGSKFRNCAKGLLVDAACPIDVGLCNTTFEDCLETAVLVSAGSLALTDCQILGAGVAAVLCRLRDDTYYNRRGELHITGLTVRDAAGIGLLVEPETGAATPSVTVSESVVMNCAGAGMDLRGSIDRVEGNVLTGNGMDGMRLTHESADAPLVVRRNTSAGNGGAGIVVRTLAPGTVPGGSRVEANLSVANGLEGFLVPGALGTGFVFNDGWRNSGADFSGVEVGGDNLSRNPQFCDPLAGDFHLAAGSPCAPSGPYGQIGALGVDCDRMSVAVDARPGSNHDQVNLGSHGLLQVGILGSRYFDVARIDSRTVRLVDAAPLQPGRSDRPRLDRDIDDDGYPDRLLSFRSDDLRLEPGSHEAALEGATFDGVAFVGRVPLEAVLHGNGIAGGKQGAKPSSTAPSGSIGYAAPAILSASFEVEGVRVRVGLPDSEIASLELFDVSGRRLAREVGHLSAGEHELQLLRTSRLGPGVYWVRLQQGTATDVERMIAVH